MTTLVSHGDSRSRLERRVPWSPSAWGQVLYLAGGIPAQVFALLLVLSPWVSFTPSLDHLFVHRHTGKFSALILVLLTLAVVFLAVPALTGIQRHRLRATAGVEVPPQPPMPGRLTTSGISAAVHSGATWRQLGYHLLAGPALGAAAAGAVMMWLTGLLFTFSEFYAWGLSPGSLLRRGAYPSPSNYARLFHVQLDVYLTLIGIALLFAAPWVTAGVRALDARAALALLGPSRADELEHRVEHLTQTRAGVVDAADAERRRLERDLHDGTQQRLVSLAMNLGMARAQASTAEEAREAIAEAHEEAKAALAELRNLIRGLHPAVLEDRGLDAALSGVAARMPIPVRLTVDLMNRRPQPVIEAVAYFVVSEGLSNIAKHAQASQAEIVVQRNGDRLHIIISDDGVGGADPSRGTGLAGLARRASSVDGTFEISSPHGGPTLLTVDLPCAR
jgi:signal transduction histidine kinase